MKKKIIIVTTALWVGGIETALINLLRNIDYNRYDVTCLIIRAELDLKDQIDPRCNLIIADREKTYSFIKGYKYKKLYHLTEESECPSRLHNMMQWTVPAIKWLENRLYISYIKKHMKNHIYDTAIIYSDVVGELTIRAIHARNYVMFYHHGSMRHVYHDGIAYKRSDHIIAVSNYQAHELKRFMSDAADKITVIHNLVDISAVINKAKIPIKENFDSSHINIVTVGRVSKEKGFDLAIEACKKLVDMGFMNIKWWIIGGGPELNNIQKMIHRYQLEDYMLCTGMKNNPYPYIGHADLYVQPSWVEGYPMTLLEALILGKIVIATCTNGAKEIIDDKVTGYLTSFEGDGIAAKIAELIRDPMLRLQISNNIKAIDFSAMNHQSLVRLEQVI